MSVPPYSYEVGQQAWTGANTKGPITGRRFHDGDNHYQISGRWWNEAELVAAETPAARPLLDDFAVDLILEALGHLAGSLTDRGHDPTPVAILQRRIATNRLRLTVLAGAATMTDTPTNPETE